MSSKTGRGAPVVARTTQSGRGVLVAGAAVGLVLAVVVGGFIFQQSRTATLNDGYGVATAAEVSVSEGSVLVGSSDAPVTLDVYEDALCPVCAQFESRYGQQIAQALDEGQVAVRYHFLDFLNPQSASGDYSTRAAGALLCVAGDGATASAAFPAFHAALYDPAEQPAEGGDTDLTNDELAALAAESGASQAAQDCVSSGAEAQTAAAASAAGQAALEASGIQVGTPTVLNGDVKVDVGNGSWLTELL